jgi:hypothetical protein
MLCKTITQKHIYHCRLQNRYTIEMYTFTSDTNIWLISIIIICLLLLFAQILNTVYEGRLAVVLITQCMFLIAHIKKKYEKLMYTSSYYYIIFMSTSKTSFSSKFHTKKIHTKSQMKMFTFQFLCTSNLFP